MNTPIELAQALWYVAPKQVEIRSESLLQLGPNQALVQSLFGAISRGTESLVFKGAVPESEFERMQSPFMGGQFPFPVKYGYCNVGRVLQGPADLLGKTVFSLSPHQTVFNAPISALSIVPSHIPPSRAVLAANMETALNGVWVGRPAPADRLAIVGGGVIGLLIAYLCRNLPGAEVTLVDTNPDRETICRALGVNFSTPDQAHKDCDVVFHASGHPAGLTTALGLAGEEATVVELSWYGAQPVSVPLGGAFHSRQLRLLSCQVGHIESSHKARWPYARRLQAAINLLNDPCLDVLLAPATPFEQLTTTLPDLFSPQSSVLCQVIQYP
jgi:2-desacetyl-2-hydroxyethyl bacteriochlorophyllide A dehydrogenase